jgi:hypothetical protein
LCPIRVYEFSAFSTSVQRGKAHRLGGGFFPLTGAAVGYAIFWFSVVFVFGC